MPQKHNRLKDDPAISSLLNDIQGRAGIISAVIGAGQCHTPPYRVTPWVAAAPPSHEIIWAALKQLSELASEAEQAYKELHKL